MKQLISLAMAFAMCLFLCSCGNGIDSDNYNDTKVPETSHEHIFKNGVCESCGAPKPSEGLEFELSESGTHYVLVGMGTCQDSDVVVPDAYEGLPVKEIGPVGADENRISSITIPNSVVRIQGNAFIRCENLTYVSIPDSVTEICGEAFYECEKLEKVDGCEGLQKIYPRAFAFCKNLKSISLPDGLSEIGDAAFSSCESLTEFKIPKSLVDISNNMLSDCKSLTEITIPQSVKTIDTAAFAGCEGLTEITIPAGVVIKGRYVFSRSAIQHIYCKVSSQPNDWNTEWAAGCDAVIHWG